MSDLAEYLQWKRDAAELAALRVEVVALRQECKRLKVKLNTARQARSKQRKILEGRRAPTKKQRIIALIEQGLRPAAIRDQHGYNYQYVLEIFQGYNNATNGK